MAHNADAIPWNVLASHLECKWHTFCTDDGVSNLYWRKNSTAKTQAVRDVLAAFAEKMQYDTQQELKKYPGYELPSPDDVIIDEALAEKIHAIKTGEHECQNYQDCCDAVGSDQREIRFFLRGYELNNCYDFDRVNGEAYEAVEIIEALIICNVMGPILRVCSYPENSCKSWQRVSSCSCNEDNVGWSDLYDRALVAYLCLNIFCCLPEIHNAAASESGAHDYRSTKCYQLMLEKCTADESDSSVSGFIHCKFFGISGAQLAGYFQSRPEIHDKYLKGFWRVANRRPWTKPFDNFLYHGQIPIWAFLCRSQHLERQHSRISISLVLRMLQSKGLPPELALEVADLAGYKSEGGALSVPHDPLHKDNRLELSNYLAECWRILVSCNMVAEAVGTKIDWEERISRTVFYEQIG